MGAVRFHFLFSLLSCALSLPAFGTHFPSGVWTDTSPHEAIVLNDGPASYAKRIEMIRTAEHSLDLRYFIFANDMTGRGLLQEIEQAHIKKPHLRIRVLLDYWVMGGGPEIPPGTVSRLEARGIEFGFYNPSYRFKVSQANRRDHGKVIVKDCQEYLVGGRNIADDYFDAHADLNYLDRDVWIRGGSAKAACESFNLFWKSELTDKSIHRDSSKIKTGDFLYSNEVQKFQKLRSLGFAALENSPRFPVNNGVSFISDHPSIYTWGRVLSQRLLSFFEGTERVLAIESPTFMPSEEHIVALKRLSQRVWIDVLTNSPQAMKVSAKVEPQVPDFVGCSLSKLFGIPLHISLFSGGHLYERKDGHPTKSLHAKTYVRDHKDVLISSYNYSPRSKNLSAETGVILWNAPDLAINVTRSIEERKKHAQFYSIKPNPDCALKSIFYDFVESQF